MCCALQERYHSSPARLHPPVGLDDLVNDVVLQGILGPHVQRALHVLRVHAQRVLHEQGA